MVCSCSKNGDSAHDDLAVADNNTVDDVDDGNTPDVDSDISAGQSSRWTITEEDIPWIKDGVVQYYQWGTAHADNIVWGELRNNKLYIGGNIGGKLDHSFTADSYLKVITDNKKVKTYRWGIDGEENFFTMFAFGPDGKIYISGSTTGDMGKVWRKQGWDFTDCVVTVLDPATDKFSFIQWGNEKACEPRTLYFEDDGTLVVIGVTNAPFPGQTLSGKADIFISRIKGDNIVTTQFGQQAGTLSNPLSMTVKTESTVYIYGNTNATLPGQKFKVGVIDAFIIGIDRKTFSPVKYYQIGTTGFDSIAGLAMAPDGKIHFVGFTDGAFEGFANKGRKDTFYGHLENDTFVIDNMEGTTADDIGGNALYYKDYIFHTGIVGYPNDTSAILVSLTPEYKVKKAFQWGVSGKVNDAGGLLAVTPEGRLYLGIRTYGQLGTQYFGDDAIDSWDAVLMTTTLSELGL